MKTDSNKTIGILTSIFIISLFVYLGIQNRKINRLQDENEIQAVELSTLKDTVAVYQSKAGELTYKLSVVEVSHSNLKESLNKAGFEIKKLKEREINWRKVNNALRLELESSGHVQTTIIDTFRIEKTDTIYYQKVNDWTDNYLSIYNAEIYNKTLDFDRTYKTGISIIQEPKRKETIVSVFLTDPEAEITTANSITIKNKKKWYERPVIWTVVGIGAGVLITK